MPGDLAFGRLQASLAQATQDFTVAAANFNFDFTLVKVEAPPEYRDIATVLSPSRVHEAETGPLHATARRLGALFEGVCPKTPNLIKAYGLRASEISREVAEAELKKTQHTRDENWIRMEYGGIDATSIWAAATSSKAALPVHLLACIIARMWLPAEATSLWTEVIAERKREILTGVEQGDWFHPGISSAVQQEITREQLAKWDSSTRAWLQSADSVRQKQYKQFLLIAQNVNVAIHDHGKSLYSNILHVWRTALSALEGLILGRPHVVRDAPVLLGLSAWHIFPDMVVFNGQSGSTTVQMKDALIKEGGILSLGFSDPGPHENQGVYWSLSLAHHTFYGKPTLQTRRLDSDGSRLTLDEFILVCMGSLLSSWRIPVEETGTALKIIQAISKSMPNSVRADPRRSMRLVNRPFKGYHDGDQQAVLATSLGRRRPNFIPAEILQNRRSFFQLTHLPTLLYLLRKTDHKIWLLRRLASRVAGLSSENSIILCFSLAGEKQDVVFASACPKTLEDQHYETPKKRGPRHHRWIERPKAYKEARANTIMKENTANDHHGGSASGTTLEQMIQLGPMLPAMDEKPSGTQADPPIGNHHDFASHTRRKVPSLKDFYDDYLNDFERKWRGEKVEYLESGKDFEGDTKPWFHDTLTETVTFEYSHGSYGYLAGQRDDCEPTDHHPICEHASLYCRGYGNSEDPPQDFSVPELTFEDVLWCFESGLVSSKRLETVLEREPAFGFLGVLSAIYSTYEDLAGCGATICSAIVDRPFQPPILDLSGKSYDWLNWVENLKINRHTVICLIGYFETADNIAHGLKPDSRVIGLSGGDSIFVLSKLVNDPGAECFDHSFTRILGNTGHPGFSIFSIPANLRAREINPAAWRIEPSPFDGTYVDCFKSTSLHLSFTEWRAPVVQVQSIGQRESNVNLIEAVISVRDSGRWVADVDIHATLSLGRPRLIHMKNDCTHSDRIQGIKGSMLSIETWDQVLDVPDGSVVVRSSNNWLARLALASVLCQHSQMLQGSIIIWPSRLCQQCINVTGHAIHIC
ncbi:hypothetical protein HD806DRAFT_517305 [Xylariaceae sp. AK1471]|nr:hypothetical protein HD806DRAFT_517305 [Xylariaceae sp. AK1471]